MYPPSLWHLGPYVLPRCLSFISSFEQSLDPEVVFLRKCLIPPLFPAGIKKFFTWPPSGALPHSFKPGFPLASVLFLFAIT